MTKKRQEAVQTERTLVEQTAIEQPKANVKYKDTIFRMLFSEPEHRKRSISGTFSVL